MNRIRALSRLMTVAALTAAVASCGPKGPKLYPVSGQVLYEGQPAEGAQVVFQPLNPPPESEGRTSGGTVGKDGTFTLRTYPFGEGAPEGEYTVAVQWFGIPGQAAKGKGKKTREGDDGTEATSAIPERYTDPDTSGLKASVKPGPNNLEPIRLTKGR